MDALLRGTSIWAADYKCSGERVKAALHAPVTIGRGERGFPAKDHPGTDQPPAVAPRFPPRRGQAGSPRWGVATEGAPPYIVR
jgi:hypothetical protein